MNFDNSDNSKKSHLSKKFDIAHRVDRAGCRISERTVRTVLTGLDAGFRKGRFDLNNSKQKRKEISKFSPKFP